MKSAAFHLEQTLLGTEHDMLCLLVKCHVYIPIQRADAPEYTSLHIYYLHQLF